MTSLAGRSGTSPNLFGRLTGRSEREEVGVYYMVGNTYEGCGHKHRSRRAASKCRVLRVGDSTPGHPKAKYRVHSIKESACSRSSGRSK